VSGCRHSVTKKAGIYVKFEVGLTCGNHVLFSDSIVVYCAR
jgi:hypothetical protein